MPTDEIVDAELLALLTHEELEIHGRPILVSGDEVVMLCRHVALARREASGTVLSRSRVSSFARSCRRDGGGICRKAHGGVETGAALGPRAGGDRHP